MRSLFPGVAALLAAMILSLPSAAIAQVPPHSPGTICFTPGGWCWAQPPGAPGQPCQCGDAGGTLG